MSDSAWVALSLVRNLGSRTLAKLLTCFDTPEAVLLATHADLLQVAGVGKMTAAAILAIELGRVEDSIARWQAAGVQVVPRTSPEYPLPLTLLDDAPPTVFVLGTLTQQLWTDAVAIVGTRQPTDTARQAAFAFARRYSEKGYTIVSGLALGVDGAAHQAALSHTTGHSAAVLGCGVLSPYPAQHQRLAAQLVAQGGVLLCECAPDAPVNARQLVARNRLITGLARLLLLVETQADGGAMHAVRFARQQQRPIYAFDLPASGNQAVIREGVERVLRL